MSSAALLSSTVPLVSVMAESSGMAAVKMRCICICSVHAVRTRCDAAGRVGGRRMPSGATKRASRGAEAAERGVAEGSEGAGGREPVPGLRGGGAGPAPAPVFNAEAAL